MKKYKLSFIHTLPKVMLHNQKSNLLFPSTFFKKDTHVKILTKGLS